MEGKWRGEADGGGDVLIGIFYFFPKTNAISWIKDRYAASRDMGLRSEVPGLGSLGHTAPAGHKEHRGMRKRLVV